MLVRLVRLCPWMVGAALLPSAFPAVASAKPAAVALGPDEKQLDRFELLDISVSKGWAAFRVIAHSQTFGEEGGGTQESVKCGYPGMKKFPRSGVVIRSWELAAGKPGKSWTVYRIAEKRSECSDKETNEANLAAAKAATGELGLDLARKPALVEPRKGLLTLQVGEKEVELRIRVKNASKGDDVWQPRNVLRITLGKRVLFTGKSGYSGEGAGRGTLEVLGAHVEGDKVVFVLKATSGDMRSADTASFGFTKPISLAD